MPQRFYLPHSVLPAVTPSVTNSGWSATTGFDRSTLSLVKLGTAPGTKGRAQVSGLARILIRQYVSDPFPEAVTIQGTVKGVLFAYTNNVALSASVALVIKVVSNSGTTLRATPLALTWAPDSNPANLVSGGSGSNYHARRIKDGADGTDIALTSYAAIAGDRLVVEFGYNDTDAGANTSIQGLLSFSDDAADAAHAEADGPFSGLNPWIEFSDTIFTVIPATINKTDSGAFSSAPVALPTSAFTKIDAGAFSSVPVTTIPVLVLKSDAGSFSSVSTADGLTQIAINDTGAIDAVETPGVVATIIVTEQLLLTSDEGIHKSILYSDTLVFLTTETASVQVGFELLESGAFVSIEVAASGENLLSDVLPDPKFIFELPYEARLIEA